MLRCLWLVAAAPLVLVACYKTPKPNCTFSCGPGGACPDGYVCGADDNVCHLPLPGGGLATCEHPPPDAAATPDGAIDASVADGPVDASVADGPVDAMPDAAPDAPIDATLTCSTTLTITSDGSDAAHQALIISEIDPGSAIELYNNSGATIDLGATQYALFSADNFALLANLAPTTSIPAGGFANVGWPSAFTDTDAGGEIVLYINATMASDFADGTKIGDFVCWGTNPHNSVKSLAETNGKWTSAAACAGTLTMSAIQRLTSTTGLDATSYDVASAPTPITCNP